MDKQAGKQIGNRLKKGRAGISVLPFAFYLHTSLCMVELKWNDFSEAIILQRTKVYINVSFLIDLNLLNDLFQLGVGHFPHVGNIFYGAECGVQHAAQLVASFYIGGDGR